MGKLIWLPIVLALLSQSRAQQAIDAPQGLIKLDVTATDALGKPISGLTQQDFTLLDNNQPQSILSFHASDRADPPTQIILLIDTLNAGAAKANEIENGAVIFLRRNGGRLSHTVTVFRLTSEGLGQVGVPSTDGNALASAVESNRQVITQSALQQAGKYRDVPTSSIQFGGFSRQWSATLQAIAKIGADQRQQPGRKLLLWVGPGFGAGTGTYPIDSPFREHSDVRQDNLHETDWFYTLMRDARLVIDVFSVGEHDPPVPTTESVPGSSDDKPLAPRYTAYLGGPIPKHVVSAMLLYKKVLAVHSGGQAFEPTPAMVDLMETCVQQADTFYTISFNPAKTLQTDDYHNLIVQVRKPDLTAGTRQTARTQTGYFNQPYYTDQTDITTTSASVEQLEQILRDSHGKRDGALAQELSQMHLTERLDGPKLTALLTDLRGDRSRQQLTILADGSAFLDPPAAEIPADAAPDADVQRHMISLALDAVSATIPKLPNVFATRTTLRYQQSVQYAPAEHTIITQPLQKADSTIVTVAYRRGGEVIEAGATSPRKLKSGEPSLIVNGTFGPLLTSAVDILSSPSHMTWKRWGEGPTGRRAVFSYTIPAPNLSFGTSGCCLPDGQGTVPFPAPATYRGEIEIDPETGALLRLELRADPKSIDSILRADVMIEYGPVDIAGKSYVCPLRSVALTRERSVIIYSLAREGSGINGPESEQSFRTSGPYATMLNDITFSNYHVFRAQSRILTGFSTVP